MSGQFKKKLLRRPALLVVILLPIPPLFLGAQQRPAPTPKMWACSSSPPRARRFFSRRWKSCRRRGAERKFCPFAFDAIAPHHPLHAVPVDGLPWTEIDFVEDLRCAREQVWPAILQRKTRSPAQPSVLASEVAAANPSTVSGD